MPIRTFSPMIDRTEISISSPIMMLWLDLRVRTSIERPRLLVAAENSITSHRQRQQTGRRRATGAPAGPATGALLVRSAAMARRSLRPHLNQIRGWVRQGRTDAWIAHQLEVTVQQIEAFKRENDLAPEAEGEPAGAAADFDDEIDLRAEDDALIAA